jgi:CRISPR-associated protein Csx3
MSTYNVSLVPAQAEGTVLLKVAFGDPGQNDQIVKDAIKALDDLGQIGGKTCLVNGPASLPVAMALAHRLVHLLTEVACFDPKLGAYVVAVSHGGRPVGTLIRA